VAISSGVLAVFVLVDVADMATGAETAVTNAAMSSGSKTNRTDLIEPSS